MSVPILREAQESVLALPNTAVASAVDVGDARSPDGSVHPRMRQVIGARLAANALSQVYGHTVPCLSPRIRRAECKDAWRVIITFVPETVIDGLVLVPPSPCPLESGSAPEACRGLSIALQ